MLAKKYKLPIQDFLSKKPVHTKHSAFFVLKKFMTSLSYSRFGIIISAKIFKKAVDRNKTRRFLFDFLSSRQQQLPTGDYLFILKNSYKDQLRTEVLIDLEKLLK